MIANIEPTATKASAPIYHLKILLNETKPPVWRRLQVSGNSWRLGTPGSKIFKKSFTSG
jgi:hypothetical protein